jgi:hypothetical protein
MTYYLSRRTNTYSLELKYVWRTNMLPSLAVVKLALHHQSRVLWILPQHLLSQVKQVSLILIVLVKLDNVGKRKKNRLKAIWLFYSVFDILFPTSMYNIESWNIWVLNGSLKHKTINDWINNHNLSIIGILETKIVFNHMGRIGQL